MRYADDCNVYVRSRRAGERVLGLLRQLYAKLRLRVNEAMSAVDRPHNRKLLGYSFYWGSRGEGVKRRVAPKALTAMKDRVRELTRPTRSQSIARVAEDLRSYLTGWRNYFRLADTPKVFRELDEWIRRRLRALQLRHWKRGRVIYRELRTRGLSENAAKRVAANARRWWKNSAMGIHIALPIRYFDQLGIPRLAAQPQLSEPPDADPHVRWCGRGPGGIPWAPMPIVVRVAATRVNLGTWRARSGLA